MKITSILYIPEGADLWQALSRLGEHADARGWPASSYTRCWPELVQLLGAGTYQVGLVPSMASLPPDRLPRIVAADEDKQWLTPGRPRWLPRR